MRGFLLFCARNIGGEADFVVKMCVFAPDF